MSKTLWVKLGYEGLWLDKPSTPQFFRIDGKKTDIPAYNAVAGDVFPDNDYEIFNILSAQFKKPKNPDVGMPNYDGKMWAKVTVSDDFKIPKNWDKYNPDPADVDEPDPPTIIESEREYVRFYLGMDGVIRDEDGNVCPWKKGGQLLEKGIAVMQKAALHEIGVTGFDASENYRILYDAVQDMPGLRKALDKSQDLLLNTVRDIIRDDNSGKMHRASIAWSDDAILAELEAGVWSQQAIVGRKLSKFITQDPDNIFGATTDLTHWQLKQSLAALGAVIGETSVTDGYSITLGFSQVSSHVQYGAGMVIGTYFDDVVDGSRNQRIFLGAGNDIYGDASFVAVGGTIYGGNGNDEIWDGLSDTGNDTKLIHGGNGKDILHVMGGDSDIWGGAGRDVFDLRLKTPENFGMASGTAVIRDFDPGKGEYLILGADWTQITDYNDLMNNHVFQNGNFTVIGWEGNAHTLIVIEGITKAELLPSMISWE